MASKKPIMAKGSAKIVWLNLTSDRNLDIECVGAMGIQK